MGDPPFFFATLLGLSALFTLTAALMLADALYQVVAGRPSLMSLRRFIRREVPATPHDCVVEGAATALRVTGFAFLVIPVGINAFITLMSPWNAPSPLADLPRSTSVVLMAGMLVSFVLALTSLVVSLALSLRIKFVPVDGEVRVR